MKKALEVIEERERSRMPQPKAHHLLPSEPHGPPHDPALIQYLK